MPQHYIVPDLVRLSKPQKKSVATNRPFVACQAGSSKGPGLKMPPPEMPAIPKEVPLVNTIPNKIANGLRDDMEQRFEGVNGALSKSKAEMVSLTKLASATERTVITVSRCAYKSCNGWPMIRLTWFEFSYYPIVSP